MNYNKNNPFFKIISKEIQDAKILYEDKILIAMKDINPVAPIHILFIPKNQYTDFHHFCTEASSEEITHYYKTISNVANDILKVQEYRLISNKGTNSGQTIFHFHTHLLSGTTMHSLI